MSPSQPPSRRSPRPTPGAAAKSKGTKAAQPKSPARAAKAPAAKASSKPATGKPATKRPAKAATSSTKSTGAKGSSTAARSTSAGKNRTPALPGPRPAGARKAPARRPLPKAAASSARFRDVVTGSVPVVDVTERAPKAAPTPKPAAKPKTSAKAATKTKAKAKAPASAPDPRDLLPAAPLAKTAFRQRYGVVHNTHGPRMRLGVLWAATVTLSLAFDWLRPYGLATVYAVAAGLAAREIVDAWHGERASGDRIVATFGASLLAVAATFGARSLGAGLLALVVAGVVAALARPAAERDMPAMSAAGLTVGAAAVCGGAAGSLVLLANYEIGAVIILITYLMVYDASDYIVGSGSSNGIEGPLAGGLFICATTMFLAVIAVPPFRGVDIWNFAGLAVFAIPAGQVLASALLPTPDADAPALRRIDSLLIVAPAWAGLIGLYLQHSGS